MTKKEYINQNPFLFFDNYPKKWSEPKYQCEKCGGNMRKNEMIVCASYPPKYQYECNTCGHIDYLDF